MEPSELSSTGSSTPRTAAEQGDAQTSTGERKKSRGPPQHKPTKPITNAEEGEATLQFLMLVLSHTDLGKPNYEAIAQEAGIRTGRPAIDAYVTCPLTSLHPSPSAFENHTKQLTRQTPCRQRRMKGIIEQAGYTLDRTRIQRKHSHTDIYHHRPHKNANRTYSRDRSEQQAWSLAAAAPPPQHNELQQRTSVDRAAEDVYSEDDPSRASVPIAYRRTDPAEARLAKRPRVESGAAESAPKPPAAAVVAGSSFTSVNKPLLRAVDSPAPKVEPVDVSRGDAVATAHENDWSDSRSASEGRELVERLSSKSARGRTNVRLKVEREVHA